MADINADAFAAAVTRAYAALRTVPSIVAEPVQLTYAQVILSRDDVALLLEALHVLSLAKLAADRRSGT
jgi:hypothetical protein